MAAGDIEVVINSETKAFRQGVQSGIIEPLDDAQKALDDLGKSRGPEQLESDMKAAQSATEKLGDATEREAQRIEQQFRDTYKKSGSAVEDFEHKAGENIDGFKEEAVQNLSEVASSWQGDLSGMADGVQGLTGGLATALEPGIGIPVAILGAAAGAFLASWQQETEATKQLISDMYDDMTQSGNDYVSEQFIQQKLGDVYKDQYDDLTKRTKELGEQRETVARAMAGDSDAINKILDDQDAKQRKEIQSIQDSNKSLTEKQDAIDGVNAKYATQNGWLISIANSTDSAGAKAKAFNDDNSDYLKGLIDSAKGATVEVDALGNKLYTLPDGTKVLVSADTGQASTNVDQFKGDVDGIPETVTTKIKADTSEFDAAINGIRKTNLVINGQVVYRTRDGKPVL